jgi:glutaredoxin
VEISVTGLAQGSGILQKQQCTVRSLYLSGAMYVIGYVAGLIIFAIARNWLAWFLWLVLLPCLKWAYLRFFPRLSILRGYGRIFDRVAPQIGMVPVEVTYYSLLGCPFCPIVERRLKELQKAMGFTLKPVDLTLKPHVAKLKGIQSVPVVEVGSERVVGNATSEELARFIARAQTGAAVPS